MKRVTFHLTKFVLSISLLFLAMQFSLCAYAAEPVFSVTGYLSPQPVTEKSVEWRSKKTAKQTRIAQQERYEKYDGDAVVESYDDEDKFISSALDYLVRNPKKTLIFYIHGCCHLFPHTLNAAQTISQKFDQPVLVYNWPSSPFHIEPSKWQSILQFLAINKVVLTHNGYSENEQGYSNGKGQFSFFFQKFDDALINKSIDGNRIIVLAHSMGNRLLDDEMEIRAFISQFGKKQTKKLKHVVFACADVGMEEFQDVTRIDRIGSNAESVLILINRKDPALRVSSRIHGYSRVGNIGPDKADAFFVSSDNFKVVDHTKVTGKDHSLPINLLVDILNGTSNSYKLVPNALNSRVLEAVSTEPN